MSSAKTPGMTASVNKKLIDAFGEDEGPPRKLQRQASKEIKVSSNGYNYQQLLCKAAQNVSDMNTKVAAARSCSLSSLRSIGSSSSKSSSTLRRDTEHAMKMGGGVGVGGGGGVGVGVGVGDGVGGGGGVGGGFGGGVGGGFGNVVSDQKYPQQHVEQDVQQPSRAFQNYVIPKVKGSIGSSSSKSSSTLRRDTEHAMKMGVGGGVGCGVGVGGGGGVGVGGGVTGSMMQRQPRQMHESSPRNTKYGASKENKPPQQFGHPQLLSKAADSVTNISKTSMAKRDTQVATARRRTSSLQSSNSSCSSLGSASLPRSTEHEIKLGGGAGSRYNINNQKHSESKMPRQQSLAQATSTAVKQNLNNASSTSSMGSASLPQAIAYAMKLGKGVGSGNDPQQQKRQQLLQRRKHLGQLQIPSTNKWLQKQRLQFQTEKHTPSTVCPPPESNDSSNSAQESNSEQKIDPQAVNTQANVDQENVGNLANNSNTSMDMQSCDIAKQGDSLKLHDLDDKEQKEAAENPRKRRKDSTVDGIFNIDDLLEQSKNSLAQLLPQIRVAPARMEQRRIEQVRRQSIVLARPIDMNAQREILDAFEASL